MILTVVVHLGLAIGLFFLVNWIGANFRKVGYVELSVFARPDEAPAFNFIFRVMTPLVFLIMVSFLLYAARLDLLTSSIYMVSIYYVVFRIFFNLAYGRARLIDWPKELTYAATIVILSFILYVKLLKTKHNLLPDQQGLTTEIWLIVILFLYQPFNNLTLPSYRSVKQHHKYIRVRYKSMVRRFGTIVDSKVSNDRLKALVYAIMIYEDFNRPGAARFFERIAFRLGRAKTLGMMQVKTERFISDSESVAIGVDKILADYAELVRQFFALKKESMRPYYESNGIVEGIAARYNPDSKYVNDVFRVYIALWNQFYPSTTDKLLPPQPPGPNP